MSMIYPQIPSQVLSFLIAVTIPLLVLTSAQAYEVDNFTRRYEKLDPADPILDKQVNQAFDKVVKRANEDKIGCSKSAPDDKSSQTGHRVFRSYLREAVAPGNIVGVFEDSVDGGIDGSWLTSILAPARNLIREKIPKHSTTLKNSIYGGKVKPSLILNIAEVNSSIRLGGEYIGSDKLGHFFDQGFEYYRDWTRYDDKKRPLKGGRSDEEGDYGKRSTGIKSYGDLAANYSGFQFWQQATEGDSPYFVCNQKTGLWSKAKDFKWSDFVNPAWDEAINCNGYISTDLEQAVTENMKALEAQAKVHQQNFRYQCPVDSEACERIGTLKDAKYFVSPKCRKKSNSQTKNYDGTPAFQYPSKRDNQGGAK